MKKHLSALLIAAGLIVPAAFGQGGGSPFEPAAAGVAVSGIIECGQGYTTHELYNMRLTLLEVVRGEAAWMQLKKASSANKSADSGFDYVLARIKFEYSARTAPGRCVHKLTEEQFSASAPDGSSYPPAKVILPNPEMRGDLHSGESMEGWVALLVAKEERKPLLNYSADAGGAVLHGGGKWFKLY